MAAPGYDSAASPEAARPPASPGRARLGAKQEREGPREQPQLLALDLSWAVATLGIREEAVGQLKCGDRAGGESLERVASGLQLMDRPETAQVVKPSAHESDRIPLALR